MDSKIFALVGAALLGGCAQSPAQTDTPLAQKPAQKPTVKPQATLDAYLKRSEAAYAWKNAAPGEFPPAQGETNLRLTSQTWQNGEWTHRLQIIKPQKLEFPDAAVINVSFGSGSFADSLVVNGLANATGAYAVNLFNVPNQPLYGKSEDDLIAYTFAKFLETGDKDWPLLLPMTKSVTAAMDALQEWSQKTGGKKIERFIIAGASKRGWTTYLAAAGDRRVVGAVPIVYNNLNIAAQLQNQGEVWAGISQKISPYTNLNLPAAVQTPRGQELLAEVDPYNLRERLTMPKLLINATNDAYWPYDATKFYLDELPGETSLYYVPNAPHTLGAGIIDAVQAAAAWGRVVLKKQKLPVPTLKSEVEGDKIRFFVSAPEAPGNAAPQIVTLWFAKGQTRDFRKSQWISRSMEKVEGGFALSVSQSEIEPFGAAFGRVEWENAGGESGLVLATKLWQAPDDDTQTARLDAPRPQIG